MCKNGGVFSSGYLYCGLYTLVLLFSIGFRCMGLVAAETER